MKTPIARPKYEIDSLLRKQQNALSTFITNPWKLRTLYALSRCRTAAMGGHIDKCDHKDCQSLHLSYNSCRNRHCPKCQGQLKEKWIRAREADLLQCSYFHVVFTLPNTLNQLALEKPKLLYQTLFKMAWSIIKDFGLNPKFLGAKTGMIAVLHTWGQNLSLHPHLHCIVPGGGIGQSGKWTNSKSKGKYLFPAKQMAKVFRARFVEALRKELTISKDLSRKLFEKQWVVYCKQPFYGPKQVIEYLGRYTHKIAISNHRIKGMNNGKVCFSLKDYKQGGKRKLQELSEQEFIRRFSLHILPKGFTRIRHYGILSSSSKKGCKEIIDQQLGAVIALSKRTLEKPSDHLKRCPYCKKGKLHTLLTFDQRGPPINWKQELKTRKINGKNFTTTSA